MGWSWIEEILGIKIPKHIKERRKLIRLRNDALELFRSGLITWEEFTEIDKLVRDRLQILE